MIIKSKNHKNPIRAGTSIVCYGKELTVLAFGSLSEGSGARRFVLLSYSSRGIAPILIPVGLVAPVSGKSARKLTYQEQGLASEFIKNNGKKLPRARPAKQIQQTLEKQSARDPASAKVTTGTLQTHSDTYFFVLVLHTHTDTPRP